MSKKLVITKADVIRAGSTYNKVHKAADALSGLDSASIGFSVSEAATIAMAAKILSKIADEAKYVLDKAEELFKTRDTKLVNRASMRFHQIDRDVEEAKAFQFHHRQAFDVKTAELQKQGFSQTEIDAVLTDPAPQIEALEQKIEALLTEKAKVWAFLCDEPIFNPELLIGTAVEVVPTDAAEAA